jgi:biotin synthase
MGAAWRQAPEGTQFERVLQMVREVKALGLEACVTLGMLTPSQARDLKDAGLDAYNHNLDTSRNHYRNIITTRNYDDRLATLRAAREAGLTLCSGGILGLGESADDRCNMLAELADLDPQPESVPINLLVPIKGTPLANAPAVDPLDLIRTIAVGRILMPRSRVRLSAGRMHLSRETQILAFFAGANSIFIGDKLLTTPNSNAAEDEALLAAIH